MKAATRSGNVARRCRCACRTSARSASAGSSRWAAPTPPAAGAYGRMAEVSPGKDSVTGHWEMTGLRLRAVCHVSHGISRGADRANSSGASAAPRSATSSPPVPRSSSGSGPSTFAPVRPIVYTSADSVFQIAAHEDVIPVREQYRICEIAFDLVTPLRVARVIARPFVGARARSRAPPIGTTTRSRPARRFSID